MICLETDVRLSESCLWEALREFYLKQGINAWNGQVPFFITSNVFFAQESARVLINYCLDLILKNKIKNNLDLTQPIYILELGAGTGQFSFYFLQEFTRLWKEYELENKLKFVYLITDLSPENIKFCEQHENFKNFKKLGLVQFINLDINNLDPINFIKSSQSKNPLITIANYLFDSLTQDAFKVQDGELLESLMTVHVPAESISESISESIESTQERVLNSLENIETSFISYPSSHENYYQDSRLNKILKSYQEKLDEGCFWLPIGAFDLLDRLVDLSAGNMLLLCTDKGYSTMEDFEDEEAPSLVIHGSFSFGVNFHAIDQWAKASGADSMPMPINEGIKSAVILWGDRFNNLKFLNQNLKNHTQELNLSDFFNFYQLFKNSKNLSIENLLSIMRWSRWDPYIFSQFSKKLIIKISQTTANLITGFIEGVDLLLDHIYLLPYGQDLYLPIAVMLHTLHFYERAIEIYKISEGWGGVKFITAFNQGLCYSQLGDDLLAQIEFKQAKKVGNKEEILKLENWLKD